MRFSEYDYYADGNKRNQKDGYYEGDKSPETTYKYDNGRLQTETDAKGNIITYVYDSNVSSIFPSKILYPKTSSIDHNIQYEEYDHRFGKPTRIIDENLQETKYYYDDFGRLEKIKNPDNEGETTIQYSDSVSLRYVITKVKESGGAKERLYEFFDGLNRLVQKVTPIGNDEYSVIQYEYDKMGRLSITKGPFLYSDPNYNSYSYIIIEEENIDKIPFEERKYDFRGRIISICQKRIKAETTNNYITYTRTYQYDGYVTTITDYDEKTIKEKRDFLGRIIEVEEEGNKVTHYRYNAANDLLSVADSVNQTITFTYDTVGRKIKMSDPDMGVWLYEYDANNNLIRQTFPNNIYSETKETTYGYDLAANGVGRLYSISNSDVIKTVTAYDKMGREESVKKKLKDLNHIPQHINMI